MNHLLTSDQFCKFFEFCAAVQLDFSPESLKHIDSYLEEVRRTVQLKKNRQEMTIASGTYAGEVLIRNLGGKWSQPTEQGKRSPARLLTDGLSSGFLLKFWSNLNHDTSTQPPTVGAAPAALSIG